MFNASRFSFWLPFSLMMLASAVFATLNLNDRWREAFQNYILSDKRTILAKIDGNLAGGSKIFTVLKVKTRKTLSLEVYEHDAKSNSVIFKARSPLPEKRDAYLSYRGNAVNLLLLDINKNGALDIVAPTYDENLVPRIHVYKYNDETGSLDSQGPENLKL